jgi:diadenosine tetraphosphate (Ap4A) HIT family hydrolase
MSEPRCLLCEIVDGKIQAEMVLETGRIAAVVNRSEALAPGHCVFFPKRHAASLHDLDDAELAEILPAIKRVATAMGIPTYNVLQNNGALAGQTVFHAHVHLIPKPSEHEGLRRLHEPPGPIDHTPLIRRLKERLRA